MKKPKWILNLMLSVITMMIAMDTFARGGGHPGSPAGAGRDWHFVTVTPKWNARVASKHHFAAMSPQQAPRASLNMSRQERRKQKRQNKKQCISSCIESFGKYYDVASFLSPYSAWGVGVYVATSIYEGVGEDAILRRGIRNQNYGNYRWGQRLISGVNLFARLNIASTIASLTGLGAQVSMQAYCRLSECRKK